MDHLTLQRIFEVLRDSPEFAGRVDMPQGHEVVLLLCAECGNHAFAAISMAEDEIFLGFYIDAVPIYVARLEQVLSRHHIPHTLMEDLFDFDENGQMIWLSKEDEEGG
jgi:hypothetical protein